MVSYLLGCTMVEKYIYLWSFNILKLGCFRLTICRHANTSNNKDLIHPIYIYFTGYFSYISASKINYR